MIIPEHLFDYNISVTNYEFASAFANTSITSIPDHLFDYNTRVREFEFANTSITTIPDHLFDFNTNVSVGGFKETLYGCESLLAIPTDLFKYNS